MKIVAVTACIAGIAHTYMAKSAIEKAAKARGAEIKVETQGSMGIENRISPEEVASADAVLFAVDTVVSDRGRFDGKPLVEVKTNDVVKDAARVIDEVFAAVQQ